MTRMEPIPEQIIWAYNQKLRINWIGSLVQLFLTGAIFMLLPRPFNIWHVAGWLIVELVVVVMFKALMFLVLEQGGVFKWKS